MSKMYGAVISAALLGLSIIHAESAETVPQFDAGPTCRGATRPEAALRDQTEKSARESCLNKEKRALEELREKWSGFPLDDRQSCIRTTSVAGIPSYVQLQTCLETRRDARAMQDERDSGATTTGQGIMSR